MAQWQWMGWINVVLALFMGSIYPLKQQIKNYKKLAPVYRKMRIIHPVTGVVMILVGLFHGYMALGSIRIHSGSLILIILILMGLTALAGTRIKAFRKNWRIVHRLLAVLLFASVLAHLIWPWWL